MVGFSKVIESIKAERRRKAWLSKKLDGMTDPHFLEIVETVQEFQREYPGIHVTKEGIADLRGVLEARQ